MAAHQVPPSLRFSRQEYWSGLPFPSPVHKSEVPQSCPTLRDPMDYSLPGCSVHGISQARVPEWVAIAFSAPSPRAYSNSCPILCNPVDCSPPGCSVHGISQVRILKWVAISSSRASSRTRARTLISCVGRRGFLPLSHQGSPTMNVYDC